MKTSSMINVLLAVALVVLSVKIAFFSPDQKATSSSSLATSSTSSTSSGETELRADAKAAAVINCIMTRTSVRAYEKKAVEEEKIDIMLRAAMAAPSARNQQPWAFVVIKDREILSSISANLGTIKMAEQAPMAIVVCGDLSKAIPGEGIDYWIEDASAATENLLLSAHALGLGAVWCGIYPLKDRVNFLSKLLRLPENIIPLNVIPIGYPAESPLPKDKYKAEIIKYDYWTKN